MRKNLLRLLIVLNLLLAIAVLAHAGGSQIIPRILFENCCQLDGGGHEVCCVDCCLRLWDECDTNSDCNPNK